MPEYEPPRRSWPRKLADAFVGVFVGIRGQSSFSVHLTMTALVVVLAVVLQVELWEWIALTLCITMVLGAEMFNRALELLAKAIDHRENPHLASGLNVASSAVLLFASGAAVCGLLVFVPHLLRLVQR